MNNGFEPKFLICTECNEEFVFTIQAQEYFLERGYSEDPKRCKSCHTRHKKGQRIGKTVEKEQAEFQYPD